MSAEFSIGDRVIVTEPGQNYPRWTEMADLLELENFIDMSGCLKEGTVCKIVSIVEHTDDKTYYGVRDIKNGREFIFSNGDGLEYYELYKQEEFVF
jgi:hypothetical protein